MDKFREFALTSYVFQLVKKGLKIEKLNVSHFLIDTARKSDSVEIFVDNLKSKKVVLPMQLAQSIFDIVKKHEQIVLPSLSEQKIDIVPQLPVTLTQPQIGEICRGRVTSINAQGAFIRLDEYPGKPIGFCHVSEMRSDPSSKVTPNEMLSTGEKIYARIIDPVPGSLALSIRDIDQITGQYIDDMPLSVSHTHNREFGTIRCSSPDNFEYQQLMKAGALKASEIPAFSSELGMLSRQMQVEEDFEIALNENVPPFLASLKIDDKKQKMESIKVFANPDGTLAKAAYEAAKLSRERQNQRILQAQTLQQNSTAGLLDEETPSVIPNKKFLNDLPEWKRRTFGSFGPPAKPKTELPIYEYRDRIREMILQNRVFILVGETGCGKTTQIPQFLYQWGITDKAIAVTQPRRVAAISVAKRVAHEVGQTVGDLIGYCVRFEECTSANTRIKYVTDGMLLKECLSDRSLQQYGIVMLDEAHERTIHTDVLFGLMKQMLETDSDIKVIVTSATLQQEKFSEFFFNCPVLTIPGRTFPVQVSYATKPFTDYLEAAIQTVLSLHSTEPKPGDILLFLTGQDDIDTACEVIYNKSKPMAGRCGSLIVLPIYSSLPSEQQSMIFETTPPGSRKVVIATNIAETSITIDGIRYVVDPGFVKELWYEPKVGMDTLKIVPISKAAANQRKGRAGRTSEGKCIRLYTEEAFNKEMKAASVPEIQRSNMAMIALQLKAMGIDDLINFPFMDRPPTQTIVDALKQLYHLEALDEEGNLTALGARMAQFPLDPQLSKMLIVSCDLGCSEEILIIVALLSVQGIWYRPRQKQGQADAMKARLNREEGDHLTLLHVYREWAKTNRSIQWCKDNFVHERSLKRADDIIKQLRGVMEKFHLPIMSCGNDKQAVQKAIVAGFFAKAARKDGARGYQKLVDQKVVHMYPGSALFGREPDYVIYHELVNTTKEFMRNVVMVEPKWLIDLAPAFYRRASPQEITRRKKHERLNPLENKKRQHERDWRITEQRVVRL